MDRKKETVLEFLRYAVVGGISAVVDIAVNALLLYVILGTTKENTPAVALSVAVGFVFGLLVNYILSNLFVFRSAAQRKKGRTVRAFLLYALVGLIGFALTEGFTLAGTRLIGEGSIWYLALTCVVKGLVLIWNYAGRKLLVYRGAEERDVQNG